VKVLAQIKTVTDKAIIPFLLIMLLPIEKHLSIPWFVREVECEESIA